MIALVLIEVFFISFFIGIVFSKKIRKKIFSLFSMKKHILIITSDLDDDKIWIKREARFINNIYLEKVNISGEDFWKLTYYSDGMENEVLEKNPITYSLRYNNK